MAAISPKPIGGLLACATASLLGQDARSAEAYGNEWSVDAAYFSYSEEERVDVQSYIFDVQGNLSDRDSIELGVVYDTMTGSTPTGAIQSASPTTVTGTSGGSFTTSGEEGALASFTDTRLAVDLEWTRNLGRTLRVRPNAYVSVESDYESVGGGVALEKDVADKQTTFSLALGGANDEIARLDGRTPVPGSDTAEGDFAGEGERVTTDGVLGITHAVNPKTALRFNLFYKVSRGYHTDPYKVVSIANAGNVELTRVYESRPTKRRRRGVLASWVHEPAPVHTLALDYRYHTDDWGVTSHKLDFRYRYEVDAGAYFVEPFGRYYTQTAADFYVRKLDIGQPVPSYVSADSRLAELHSVTFGAKVGAAVGTNGRLKLRAFRFEQYIENAVFEKRAAEAFQVTYSHDFR